MLGRLASAGALVLAIWGASWANHPPVVSNVQAQQREGTALVDITYDVEDEDGDTLTIRVYVSNDGGKTYKFRAVSCTGDVGPGVLPGTGKHIVWDAGKDVGEVYWEQCRIKVVANDNKIMSIMGIDFVFVPGGEFKMGDLWGDGDSDERPAHLVRVGDFWMSKYEITVGQFRKFVDDTGYKTTAEKRGESNSWLNPGFEQDDTHPVVRVSWYDAVAFCNWLSRQAGLEEVYDEETWEADFSKVGYRLPTEAEWEYAARAGGKEIKYPWGNEDPYHDGRYWMNYSGSDDGYRYTSPVGSFPPNALGLYDMAGNVWEWCNDWYSGSYYAQSPVDNPTGPSSGSSKVLRGGSWFVGPWYCRTANRNRDNPDFTGYIYGFRVVLPVR